MTDKHYISYCPACDRPFESNKSPEVVNSEVYEHLQRRHPEYAGIDEWVPEEKK